MTNMLFAYKQFVAIAAVLVLASSFVLVDAFSPYVIKQQQQLSQCIRIINDIDSFEQKQKNLVLLLSSNNDNNSGGGSDWYSDFNPGQFRNEPQQQTSGGDGDRFGGQRRPSRFNNNNSDNYQQRRGGGGGGRDGGGGGGGRGGGGYRNNNRNMQYERDTSMDNSNVNVNEIEVLLQDRVVARKDGDFDTADQIRDQLLNTYGVQVWDKDRIWRSGCSPGGSGGGGGNRFGRSNNNDRDGGGGNDFGRRNGGRPQQRQRRETDFGPNGHDYELAYDAGPISSTLSEEEIHTKIAERLQYKLSKRYSDADDVQSVLASFGVYIHDGKKEWRADGEFFGDNRGDRNGQQPGRVSESRSSRQSTMYTQSEHSENDSTAENDVQEIEQLVTKRIQAKASRDYNTADEIREELKSQYNVYIDDRLMEWSVNGNFGPQAQSGKGDWKSWSQSSFSDSTIMPVDETIVLDLLQQRDDAKATRNYETADTIRDTLQNEYTVTIHDRLREWSIGGDFGIPENPRKALSRERDNNSGPVVFQRRRSNVSVVSLSDIDLDTITNLVMERSIAKKERDFDKSDMIRDQLEQQYNVKVDDKNREWMVVSDEYALAGRRSNDIDDYTIDYIQRRLKDRSACKAERDYNAADAIRDELQNDYNIKIDDRTREYSFILNEFTIVDNDNNNNNVRPDRIFRTQQPQPAVQEDIDDIPDSVFDFLDDIDTIEDQVVVPASTDADDATTTTTGTASSDVNYSSMTVVQLKDLLRENGLPVSGNKAELITRLESMD